MTPADKTAQSVWNSMVRYFWLENPVSDWDYQMYWHNGIYLCLLEANRRTGESCVSFRGGHTKWRFTDPTLRQMVLAVVVNGQPLYGLLDYLMEWEGWANDWDRTKFRSEVAEAMERLAQPEVPT